MTPERWAQVGQLHEAALELKPEERAAFLNRACGEDQALRREVESLLAAEMRAGDFLVAGAMKDAAKLLAEEKALSLVGKRLGHYQILSLVGTGGMGEVYRARDAKLGREVAIKVLPAAFSQDADRLHRFEQEARTASALNHPNIITIYEIGQAEDVRYIVTEFIDGQTLRQQMKRARLGLSLALEVAAQTASALEAAHAAGIMHRDIKPENIMRRRDGLVKVLDFGLAKLIERQAVGVDTGAPTAANLSTEPGTVMGTAQYMSPEQARGLDEVDARSDIFSLGIVLYEMITGRAPFEGPSVSDVIAAILTQEPPPLSRYAPEVPSELDRVVTKALEKDREERYQRIKDLLLDLKRLQQRLEFEAEQARSRQPDATDETLVTTSSSGQAVIETAGKSSASAAEVGAAPAPSSAEYLVSGIKQHKRSFAFALAVLLLAAVGFGYWFFARPSANTSQIESIAVMPFQNASGNADVEYLSDGITESLINSLSQLSHLSVKARSSVFRYKGKEVEAQQVAAALSVQAILNGRVVQRGDDLTLYISLVDGRNGNQLWGEQYHRKLTDLVTLQNGIAREVSQKLRARLSSADEQKLAKTYTTNTEAYQLYLKGRYHAYKLTPPETQRGISYFQQAIKIDPSYALAYVGLADAYRSLPIAGEMPSTELLPKAKEAAQKAIGIDDTLAEAHAVLGFIIFWYDWNWNAAENQFKRALELNPNSADTHLAYAHLLSSTGRHAEALTEIKHSREIDPLNVRTNALEGQYLTHAGRTDEALAVLQKTFELEPNFWLAHLFASSAYIEKGMFAEAAAEARKARALSGVSTHPLAFLSYALAKLGKQAEARAVLEELLKLSKERYVSPYNIALVYNGLGERDETLAWLERAYEQRDARMTFLKVEPKWNNLRDDPRFQDLLRRVGLTP